MSCDVRELLGVVEYSLTRSRAAYVYLGPEGEPLQCHLTMYVEVHQVLYS